MRTRKTGRKGRIKSTGERLPVVEARDPFEVYVLEEDVARAVQGKPTDCGAAMSMKRTCKTDYADFRRSVAYIKMLDEHGVLSLVRFDVPKKSRDKIVEFDKSGVLPSGALHLSATPKDRSYRYRKLYNKLHGDSRVGNGPRPKPKYRRRATDTRIPLRTSARSFSFVDDEA